MLKDSVDTGNIIAARTTEIASIISGALIAFMSYLFTKLRTAETDSLFCIYHFNYIPVHSFLLCV